MKKTIKITENQMKKIIDKISEGEYHVDEEVSPEEVKTMKQDLTDISVLTKELGLTSETEELSDEDIFLEEEGIDPSKGIAGLPMA